MHVLAQGQIGAIDVLARLIVNVLTALVANPLGLAKVGGDGLIRVRRRRRLMALRGREGTMELLLVLLLLLLEKNEFLRSAAKNVRKGIRTLLGFGRSVGHCLSRVGLRIHQARNVDQMLSIHGESIESI